MFLDGLLAGWPKGARIHTDLHNRLKQHMRDTNDPFDIDRPELCHTQFEGEIKLRKKER